MAHEARLLTPPSPPGGSSATADPRDAARQQPPAAGRPTAPQPIPPPPKKHALPPSARWQGCKNLFDSSDEARRAKAGRPNPWISRKAPVGFVFAVVGWTIYVFIVRVCVPMIQGRALSVARGIVLLVLFCVLLLMFVWSYLKIITVGPGYARDVVKPGIESQPYEAYRPQSHSPATAQEMQEDRTRHHPSDIEMRESQDTHGSSTLPMHSPPSSTSPLHSTEHDLRPHDTILAQAPAQLTGAAASGLCKPPPRMQQRAQKEAEARVRGAEQGEKLERLPPRPEEDGRWCYYCNLARPLRTHHSSAGGTCIRKFDHYCPWVGQEVGQLNHKFFVVFCFWSLLWTSFILIATAASLSGLDYDGRAISLLPLAALYTLLGGVMCSSHVWMVLHNITTLEQVRVQDWQEGEEAILDSRFSWYQLSKKAAVRRRWKDEWGSVWKEGNRWFVGYRRNWEGTMGTSPWLWLLPVGGPAEDKVEFPVNPRVGEDGGWRKRAVWPDDLR